jgi:regulator of RNase E activity RraA
VIEQPYADGVRGEESDHTVVTNEHLDALRQVSTATLATQMFSHGLRNQALTGLRLMSSNSERMVGPAYTLRNIPAREDLDMLEVFRDYDHPQRLAIENCPPGHVLVIDSRGDGRAASGGHILMTRLQTRRGAGCVTDGTMRDTGAIAELHMPVFGTGASPTTNLALHHAVDVQVPIGCAGVAIYPGDIIVGDADGVVCVPRHLVPLIAGPAVAQERLEDWILAEVESGEPLRGTYPPAESTLARYQASSNLPSDQSIDHGAAGS